MRRGDEEQVDGGQSAESQSVRRSDYSFRLPNAFLPPKFLSTHILRICVTALSVVTKMGLWFFP